MYIIRPKGILGTPRQLARDLGWRTRRYPNPRRPHRRYDYRRDFFMVPVDPEYVTHATESYLSSYQFLTRNKLGQRQLLGDGGIPVPRTAGSHAEAYALAYEPGLRFVVRPLRHSGGRGYRVTENPVDFIPGQEYISELYPKKREYRVIFALGKPVVILRKKPAEGVDHVQPWGHANSFFQTVNDVSSCRLMQTDCVRRLAAFPPIMGAHLIAADVLYNSKQNPQYVVLELNNCPGMSIDENRAKVVGAIRHRHAPITMLMEAANRTQPRRW